MTVPRGHEPKGKNGGIPELAKAFLKWSMDGGGPDAAPGKETLLRGRAGSHTLRLTNPRRQRSHPNRHR